MKNLEFAQLRQLDAAELQAKAIEYKSELFTSRFALRTGQLADPTKIRKARRAFAQVQTLLSERRLSASVGGVS